MGMRTRRSDSGSVVLETAFAIPALIAVTVALIWVVSLGATYVRLLDTAQTTARHVARGAAAPAAPDGAQVTVTTEGDLVRATVWREVTAPVPIVQGLSVRVSADATAALEVVAVDP